MLNCVADDVTLAAALAVERSDVHDQLWQTAASGANHGGHFAKIMNAFESKWEQFIEDNGFSSRGGVLWSMAPFVSSDHNGEVVPR